MAEEKGIGNGELARVAGVRAQSDRGKESKGKRPERKRRGWVGRGPNGTKLTEREEVERVSGVAIGVFGKGDLVTVVIWVVFGPGEEDGK